MAEIPVEELAPKMIRAGSVELPLTSNSSETELAL